MSRFMLATAALGLSALPAAAGCVGQCYQQTYVPPSYETVTEKVMVRAPRTYAVTTPAQYRTYNETVQVSAGGRYWSTTTDAYGRKIGCWVSTPPRYATVARTVMVQAPQVIPYSEPAQYGFRSHTVLSSPGYKTWAPVSAGFDAGYAAPRYTPSSYAPSYGPSYEPRPRSRQYGEPRGYRRSTVSKGYDADAGYGPRRSEPRYGEPSTRYSEGTPRNYGNDLAPRRASGFDTLDTY